MFRLALFVLFVCPIPAGALTLAELATDPRWACALDRARGDLLAEAVLPSEAAEARDPVEQAQRERRLRHAAERGDAMARAALGWWRRADAAGCR